MSGSSLGYSMLEHSLQNLKVICSMFFLGSSPALDAGEAIAGGGCSSRGGLGFVGRKCAVFAI